MNKNDNIHILFKTLTDTLPYEYNETLVDNGKTILLTKENSDLAMLISPDEYHADDFTAALVHDDTDKGYYTEYGTLRWSTKDEQIPLDAIIADIKNYL